MRRSTKLFVALALALAVGLASGVSPYASSSPDGLSKVADTKGFGDRGSLHTIQNESPVPGYAFPGIGDQRIAKGAAGFVGTLGVFGVAFGLAYVLRRRHDDAPTASPVHGRAV
jgi:hypothetical protein